MKSINIRLLSKIGFACTLSVVVGVFGSAAMAQCGGSFSAMAAAAAATQKRPVASETASKIAANDSDRVVPVAGTIVGLWHVRFMVGAQTIQEAYQTWSTGGTEAHNPNVDPRGGSICLGAWIEAEPFTFKLTHRVWNYDTAGNFMGTIKLTETLILNNGGNGHIGTFRLAFYDPAGNFLFDVPGNVVGERISVE